MRAMVEHVWTSAESNDWIVLYMLYAIIHVFLCLFLVTKIASRMNVACGVLVVKSVIQTRLVARDWFVKTAFAKLDVGLILRVPVNMRASTINAKIRAQFLANVESVQNVPL